MVDDFTYLDHDAYNESIHDFVEHQVLSIHSLPLISLVFVQRNYAVTSHVCEQNLHSNILAHVAKELKQNLVEAKQAVIDVEVKIFGK